MYQRSPTIYYRFFYLSPPHTNKIMQENEKNLSFQTSHERWHSGFVGTPLLFTMHLTYIVFQSARNVRWRRLAIPRLLFRNYNHSLLLYFLVADPRLFLVSPAGIRRRSPQRNGYSVRRVPHNLIRRCQADPGSKTGRRAAGRKRRRATYALFICLRCTPKGTCSGLDFDEFNLAFAQGSERAEWD